MGYAISSGYFRKEKNLTVGNLTLHKTHRSLLIKVTSMSCLDNVLCMIAPHPTP